MDNRAIGVFDSGLGGLTAVKALRELLPNENIIYFADSGRVPYGAWSRQQLRAMSVQDMDFVAQHDVKAIVAACGTVSSNAGDILDAYPLPVFGVLRSSVRAMAQIPGNAPFGIAATAASIKSGAFAQALEQLCPGREIISVACPDFVPLIEAGRTDDNDPLVLEAVSKYLSVVKEAGACALLLGCTHYGLISGAIRKLLGEQVRLISASQCAAADVAAYLKENGLCGGSAQERYFTSASAETFRRHAGMFLGYEVGSVEEVPVMEVKCI